MNRWLYIFWSLFLALSTVLLALFYFNIVVSLPKLDLIDKPPKLTSKILDKNGRFIYGFFQDENRLWVSLDQIPLALQLATIAIEDKDFYKHHGLSLRGIVRAAIYNFRNNQDRQLRGGSTISQQLVKNIYLDRNKTWQRKIKEALLTIIIESRLSKSEILEKYLNQVSYGGTVYGVGEAAKTYFGKSVSELDLNQSIFLAGLPAAPGVYSPFGPEPGLAEKRRLRVIEEMVAAGFLSDEVAHKLKNNPVSLEDNQKNVTAPHFAFYAAQAVKNILKEDDLANKGLMTLTTLDLDIQNMAQSVVKDEVDKAKRLGISNGAALVIDVKTGAILAMVGSKDYFATDIDGKFNVTTSIRQPGSSIKPINYLLAISNGWPVTATVNDSPVVYLLPGQKPYSPKNYTGRYLGQVTLRTALASSLNIPAVKLLYENGVGSMIELGQSMGITSWGEKNRFGLSLTLGGGEVKLIDLAQAYSVFANGGIKVSIDPIEKINSYQGESIYVRNIVSQPLLKPENVFLINDILSDNAARTPIFGPNSRLVIRGKTVAVKTGTTNNLRDNWCIGWTPSYLVAVWVGNNDNHPMSWVASGVSGATPIWQRIMEQVIKSKPDEKWDIPPKIVKGEICGKTDYYTLDQKNSRKCHLGRYQPRPIDGSDQFGQQPIEVVR